MKRVIILLAALFSGFGIAGTAQAQVRVVTYDFENHAMQTAFEHTDDPQINGGNLALIKVGSPATIRRTAGAGMALHGQAAAGSAASATIWSVVQADPGVSATTYFQLTIDTSRFAGVTLSFDVWSGTTPASHPHIGALISTDGGNRYSPLLAGCDTGNNLWINKSVDLPPAADHNRNVIIRIYGYASDGTGKGVLALDNLTISARSILAESETNRSLGDFDFSTLSAYARTLPQRNQADQRQSEAPAASSDLLLQKQFLQFIKPGLPIIRKPQAFSLLWAEKILPALKPVSSRSMAQAITDARVTDAGNNLRPTNEANTSPAAAAVPPDATTVADQTVTTQEQKTTSPATVNLTPSESRLIKAHSFDGDLRNLPYVKPFEKERPEREPPETVPVPYGSLKGAQATPGSSTPAAVGSAAPAPSPTANFEGLDFATWGAGHPPDPTGDVGKTYFIQAVNTSLGIYRKSDGVRVAAFTFDTFMSQGNFGNLCDTDNFGDPVVLYDSFEDRWIITDFAFQVDGSGNVINPPGAFQCFAASKTGDPVSGGWNFYSINTTGGLGDYPKFGIWPDGLYMSANIFGYPAGASFQNPRVYAFNKAQMYAGAPSAQVVSFDAPSTEFTLLPANARLQAGTPPAGSPNYFSVVWQFTNAVSVYKFHVDWNSISTSTFTGPFITIAPASWANPPNTVPSQSGNALDTLAVRLMMQNQYTNVSGVESLWNSHTVQGSSVSQAAVRYYQVAVTGGTIAASTTQAFTHNPDATMSRFMPSLAVDRAGDMALGYSTSNSTSFPAIKYAGRLSTDAVNTIPQTETSLINGTGTQTGNCGGAPCNRWGDYSAMSLDPDGCTFWYTNEYYQVSGLNNNTRIGSFKFPQCTPVGNGGTVSGTVTATTGGAPISGATVALGSRTTATNGSGNYSFTSIPAGTYPSITASMSGFNSSTAGSIVVTDGGTTTQNFSLSTAPTSACVTDTSAADFLTGVPTSVDLTTSSGNVILFNPTNLDQSNTSVTSSGFSFNTTNWFGQTFTAGVSGTLQKAEVDLFCSNCTGTTPNITVSVRATNNNLPTGSDLATATITGFSSGAGGFFTATFSTPPTLTSGTQYALVLRPVSNPSAGTYAYVISTNSPYAGGRWVTSNNSGTTWSGQTADVGFKTYMKAGFVTSGNLVSSAKDANPAAGNTTNWTTLSWTNPALPSGTALKFQAAGSNNAAGPFNFVGPDGTANTFFSNGGSLTQFNGLRYLKYKALLSTSNTANTPTLNDATICYSNLADLIYNADGNLPAGTYNSVTVNAPSVVTVTGNVTVTSCVIVNSGATLNMGSSIISGPGCFTLNSGGTLGIGHPNGITTSGASGNVQVTGTRTYNIGANYTYNGSAAQATGNGLPATANNLTVNNNAGLSLSNSLTTNGTLALTSGALTIGANTLTINNAVSTTGGSLIGGGTSNIILGDAGSVPSTTLPGVTVNNLTVNRAAGISLGGNVTVNTTLALTSGDLNTNAFTLFMGNGATSTGTADVIGDVNRADLSSNVARSFGNPNVRITITAGTVTGMTVNLAKQSPTDFGNAVRRTYTLKDVVGTLGTATVRLHYLTSELNNNTETSLSLWRKDTSWTNQGSTSQSTSSPNNYVESSLVTAFSPWTLAANAPTAVEMMDFAALRDPQGNVLLEWQTGYEVSNLGFNVYREQAGRREKINPTLLAGSVPLSGRTIMTAGLNYVWMDKLASAQGDAQYWIEDVDLSGKRLLHGPINAQTVTRLPDRARSLLLSQLYTNAASPDTQRFLRPAIAQSGQGTVLKPSSQSLQTQWEIAAKPGAKFLIAKPGWYRVTQPELVAAGFDVSRDPRFLQLFTDAREVPILVNGGLKGRLEPADSIEFFGQALDSPSSNRRSYYLINAAQPGRRLPVLPVAKGDPSRRLNFTSTVERRDRFTYFPSLNNGEAENWFGAIVSSYVYSQSLTLGQLDQLATSPARLEVALQGLSFADPPTSHIVQVQVNGQEVGSMVFDGQQHQVSQFSINPQLLQEGPNTVTLTASGGDADFSLIDWMKLSYAHRYEAEENRLLMSSTGGEAVQVSGFTTAAVRVFDITDETNPVEMKSEVEEQGGEYRATVVAQGAGERVLLAVGDTVVERAAQVVAQAPSSWHLASQGADVVMITHGSLRGALEPLLQMRKQQGYAVAVVDVEDLYDENSYGEHRVEAIRDFLVQAKSWKRAPRFVLLVGDASSDAKNYLGLGENDLVPTKLIWTNTFETASDDWLADTNGDGVPEMAVGRLPVRTVEEAVRMISKIIDYKGNQTDGALLVADRNDGFDFEAASNTVQGLLPAGLSVKRVFRSQMDDQTASRAIIDAINRGPKLVNYAGHGSSNLWRGNLLTTDSVGQLTNQQGLPVVISMTCLNALFNDAQGGSLGEALLLSDHGGAIAVWASSALTAAGGQALMNQEFIRQLFQGRDPKGKPLTLGEAAARAKAAVGDLDIRKSWILLGDPMMQIK